MAIGLRGTGFNSTATANVDLTVTLPGGMASGDVVYAACNIDDNANIDRDVATVTSGYTELCDMFATDNEESHFGVFRKVQGGTPDSTVVFAGNGLDTWGICGIATVLTGVDNTTPEDATTTTATLANDGIPNPPSITTVTANAWVLAIGGSSDSTPSGASTAPSSYSNMLEALSNAGWGRVMMATRLKTTAGAENPGAFGVTGTTTNDCWNAATVAVRAAIDKSLVFNPPPAAFIAQLVR